jgi:hypothetical protein
MKRTCEPLQILMLAACGKAAPTDTVDSLVAHPDRLKEVQRLCQEDYAKMGEPPATFATHRTGERAAARRVGCPYRHRSHLAGNG